MKTREVKVRNLGVSRKTNMKKINLIVFLVLLVLGLSLVRTFLSTVLSTSGAVLGSVEDEISKYETENAVMKEKLFTLASLNNIASKAAELGFVEEKANFSVKTKPIAAR